MVMQKHTAICGFKEWIFSHKAGALASFAAATEYAFATVIQVHAQLWLPEKYLDLVDQGVFEM
jgi:hypothetical protein